MDPITLAVGAGILGVGLLVGHVTGRRAAAHQRPGPPSEPICGCRHHRALHDPDSRECHHQDWHLGLKRHVQCACRQYVGPEPITSFWTPPLAEESERPS